jgi:hypothetical protein
LLPYDVINRATPIEKQIKFKIRNVETKTAAFETASSATVQAPRRFGILLAKPSFQWEDAEFYESFLFPWECLNNTHYFHYWLPENSMSGLSKVFNVFVNTNLCLKDLA